MQHRRRNQRVGEDESQHRRHVGGDHAGSLCDAGDGNGRAVDGRLARRSLGEGVGGHDGARRCRPVGVSEVVAYPFQVADDVVGRQGFADDPGRRDKNGIRLARQQIRRGLDGQANRLDSGTAGEGVGVAGIDDERPSAAAGEGVATPINGRRRGRRSG